ncbi:hypothetical protein E2C01_098607 [Portunus trituberculatus]|uniref:Uncharacterized protein n=1 Tax=Portunus trituberculatus TaxID=210409 RepID=A0A5B7K8P2_PORTR|nr:hypothetical protein [Portunus trituberculatus]
MWQRPAHTFSL